MGHYILKDCSLKNASINADSIAFLYGLTLEDLKTLDLISLGNKVSLDSHIDTEFIKNLMNIFIQKHWFLGAILLD